jgi:hypothetical protein
MVSIEPATTGEAPAGGIELTVLMPCLDEAATVGACVRLAATWLRDHGVDGEVLVADNGSTDGSQDLARAAGARVVDVPERGYGAALRAGIEAARGRYVVMGDADSSYDFGALGPFLDELRAGGQLVIGNRFAGGIEPGAMPPLHRYLGNPVLSAAGRLLFRVPVRDFHCGLRGVDRQAALDLHLVTPGMEFASEMVVKAAMAGYDIREVPTTLKPDGRERAPHLRTWSDGWRHLRFLLLYSPRWLFLVPGLVLLIGGLAASTALVIGPVEIGSVTFDVGTLVYTASATIVGAQAIGFHRITRAYAEAHGLTIDVRERPSRPRWLTLERTLLLSALIIAVGLGLALVSLLRWRAEDFGDLDTREQIRVVVPAALGFVHGVSLAFTAFAVSIARMDVGRP